MAVIEIELEQLKIHPKNVRTEYEGIDELAKSIKENGIMQNLTVVPDKDDEGKYFVVIGNRRLTAARQAGVKTAPCVVIEDMSDREQIATMLTENMNRKDLKIYEEASAIQMCFKDYGFDMQEIEDKTGLSNTTIAHRLNIAKLDKRTLKKVVQDEEFQLTLSDLYALEKVEDVKTRNKILKDARDSKDLANKARQAAREEKQRKVEQEIIGLCKKRGIEKAPKSAEDDWYSGKWIRAAEFNLDDKAPKQLKIGKEGEFFYITRYGRLYIISKAAKAQKKEPTKQEIEEREKKKRTKEINAKYKAMFEDMGDFVRGIFDGKIAMIKDLEEVDRKIWELLIRDSTWIGFNHITQAITGKEIYSSQLTAKERDEAEEKAKNLPVICQKLGVAYWKIRELRMTEWDGTFRKSSGEQLNQFYDILNMFGYSWADEDSEKIANGKHELYEKKSRA